MGIQAQAREFRINKILELVEKHPLTIKELVEATNSKYHTVRLDVTRLVEEGKMSPTGETRQGAVLFRQGRTRPMPMVYHKGSNQRLSLMQVMESYCKNPLESASSRATLDVGAIASEMLYLLALSTETGHPSSRPLQESNQSIASFRTRLTTDVLHIESILGIAKDMLKDETLWKTKEFEAVAGDTLFDATRIISLWESLLRGSSK